MKVAILGFDKQGRAAFKYWGADSTNVLTICDINPNITVPDGVESQLGPNYLADLDRFDLLVRTPGLHPQAIAENNFEAILNKVTTVTNEFFKVCPTRNIIGVTGTKGKGTTSTLIAKILEAVGKRVHLGGNIGIPPLEMLKNDIKPVDWVVLELANFQLIDLRHSPHIAVCLMIVPEHQDWHADMQEYVEAKKQLFAHQKTDDIAIYYAVSADSQAIASVSKGTLIPYSEPPGAAINGDSVEIEGQQICQTSEVKLLGRHNLQNICAAITAAWQITQNAEAIRSVIVSFSGLGHRLEFVRELDGVKYYDDSFGTTPETAIVAIEAFTQPKVVILGGSNKGANYDQLAKTVKNSNVRGVVAIGDQGPKITDALRAAGFDAICEGGSTMPEIVKAAKDAARPGDIVLLSTGCASFGLFKSYKDRAEQFIATVQALT